MAAKIPLNKFKSKFIALSATNYFTRLYTAPDSRATIIVFAQVANTTAVDRTISVAISSTSWDFPSVYFLVKDFPIPANDARSVIAGRAVLQGADNDEILTPEILIAQDTTVISSTAIPTSGLNISLGLLETININ